MARIPIGTILEVREDGKVLVDFGRWTQVCDPYFQLNAYEEEDPVSEENTTPPEAQDDSGINPELLAGLRAKKAAGEKVTTQFDRFWNSMVPRLKETIRNQLGVEEEKQVETLLRMSEGIARMTWASQLRIISESLSQGAEIEMAVIQVNAENVDPVAGVEDPEAESEAPETEEPPADGDEG